MAKAFTYDVIGSNGDKLYELPKTPPTTGQIQVALEDGSVGWTTYKLPTTTPSHLGQIPVALADGAVAWSEYRLPTTTPTEAGQIPIALADQSVIWSPYKLPTNAPTIGQIPVALADGSVAWSDAPIASVPSEAITTGLKIKNQTGGTNGKVLRLTSADTWVDAIATDTINQLYCLCFKWSDEYYLPGSYIYDATSAVLPLLTANSIYFLDTTAGITTTEPVISAGSNTKRVPIGKALSDKGFYFNPGVVISG